MFRTSFLDTVKLISYCRFIICLILSLTCFNINAQTSGGGVVSGSLIDEKKIALPFATIVLKNAADSTIYKAVVSNEAGIFKIDQVKAGSYTLEIKMLGYETLVKPNVVISDVNHFVDLGTLQLLPATKILNAVTITAPKPFIERRADKIVVNLNAAITDGSIMDVMNKLPGVIVNLNDQITLDGNAVRIYIDGKATPLTPQALAGLLKGMPPSGIQKVELIAHPSARYDASGNAGIINIIRKRNVNGGLIGNIYGGGEQWQNGKHNGGLNLNYRAPAYNLLLNLDYSFNKSYLNSSLVTDMFNHDLTLNNETSGRINTIRQSRSYTPGLGIDLYLTKKTTLSFSVSKGIQLAGRNANSYTNNYDGSKVKSGSILFLNNVQGRTDNFSSGMHLSHQIDSLGKEYTVDVDYLSNSNGSGQDNSSTVYNAVGSLVDNAQTFFDQDRKYRIYSAKADYSQPLKNKGSIETGWKSSLVQSDNGNRLYNVTGETMLLDPAKNDFFKYTENINAVYFTYSRLFKKLSYNLGIRAEYTTGEGKQVQTGEIFNRNYFQVFPSAFFSYKINRLYTLNLTLSKKTERPGYENLNPLIRIINSTNYAQGNPNLQPIIIYNTSLTYSYKNALYATLNYSINLHDFTYFTSPYNNDVITIKAANNRYSQLFNLNVGYNKQLTPWWFTGTGISFKQQSFKSMQSEDVLNTAGMLAFNFDTYDEFKITKKLAFMLLARYKGKSVERNITNDPYFLLIPGVKQAVLNNKGTISLNFSDVFHSYKNNYVQNSAGIKQYWKNQYETQLVRFSFTYNFYKTDKKIKKAAAGSGAEEEKKRTASSEDKY